MNYNIITVAFGALQKVTALPINYKYDIGQILRITGLDLPESYVVDFCNQGDSSTISMVGTADGVRIPDQFLQTGKPVKAYIVLSGADNTQTRYEITIPVNARPERTDIQPTPEEQSTIDSLIAAMNTAVEESDANADRAESEADRAATEADRAEQAAESIGDKVERAEAAAQTAESAATNAEDAKDAANLFASNAAESAEAAHLSEVSAEDSASTATAKAAEASQSAASAAASAASIEGDVAEAQQAAQTATQAASQATQSATSAQGSASAAESSATTATTKAAEASASATTATGKAAEASASATAAQTAQTGAETAQTAAEAAQQAAEEAAQEAGTILVDKAPVITDTASGAIASFPDGAAGLPLKSLVASIEPQQDLHGYDSPWPTGGGKNKYSGDTITLEKPDNRAKNIPINPIPVGDYTVSWVSNATNTTTLSFRDENNNALGSAIVTTSGNKTISFTAPCVMIYAYISTSAPDGATATISNIQIESGSTATAWSPYENECPISGWTGAEIQRTGKNLFDSSEPHNFNNRTVVFGGTAQFNYNTYLKAGTYTISVDGVVAYAYCRLQGATTNMNIKAKSATSATFTIDKSGMYAIWLYSNTDDISASSVNYVQIEYGSTATDYEPYHGSSLSINWQDEAGTVHDGTLAIAEDGSCKLTVDMAMADMGNLNWTYDTSTIANTPVFCSDITGRKLGSTKFISSQYKNTGGARTTLIGTDACMATWNVTSSIKIAVTDSRFTDAASFKSAVSGVQLCYEIATPITYTLPDVTMLSLSTVLGTNNIWVDTGDVSAEYRADTKLYIDKKLAALVAALS